MKKLIKFVEELKNSRVKKVVKSRMKEFEEKGRGSADEIFKELCFCLLTANFTAERGMKIQEEIGDGFLNLNEKELAVKLKELGHRFPNMRAKFIAEAKDKKDEMNLVIKTKPEKEAREWLVKNIKGLGMKESSHFLRNIGFNNLAIIDFHIVDILEEYGLVEKPKTMNAAKYIEIENVLGKLGEKTDLKQGELDLYLWYKETGKILK